jgi:hypothetical protein
MTRAEPGSHGPGGATHQSQRDQSTDLYELLEVSPHARQAVIHAAYRALVRDCHPDVNDAPEAAQRARQLNAAYAVLSDPGGRARYDLDRMRERRLEFMRQPTRPSGLMTDATRAPTVRLSATRPVHEERAPRVSGQLVLGLIVALFLTTMVFFIVVAALDATSDDTPRHTSGPTTQVVQR